VYLEDKALTESANSSIALFLHIKFETRQKKMAVHVALYMHIPSLNGLRSLMAGLVTSIT
jgi:hypothetical protein